MPSRASLSPCLSFYLSLPLSRFLPPSFSIPLSPPQLCASLSFHFHQLHPLFHPCAFHSLPGGCPSSSSIIHLALIQDTNRVCLVLIPVTHLASFSRKRGGREEEGERERRREAERPHCLLPRGMPRSLFLSSSFASGYHVVSFCLPSRRTPSFSAISLFLETTPLVLVYFLSLSLSSCLHLFSFSNLPTISILPKAPPRYVFLSPSRVYPLCVSSPSRFHLRVHPPVFFSSTASPSTLPRLPPPPFPPVSL